MKKFILLLIPLLLLFFSCSSTPSEQKSAPKIDFEPETDLELEEEIELELTETDSEAEIEIVLEPELEIEIEKEPELAAEGVQIIGMTNPFESLIDDMEQHLTDMEAMLGEMDKLLDDLEQFLSESAETPPAVITQAPAPVPAPTPAPVPTPTPAPAPIPAPVPAPVQQAPVPPPVEEEPPVNTEPRRDLPSAPATRIESLTQMGLTPLDSEVIYSRIVRATVGQIVEIPFRGNGWVYLGELASRRGIVYNSRRNDQEGQSFIFTLEEAGTYVLKFYRQDFIRDFILNDHVQVIAGEAPVSGAGWFGPAVDRGRVIAQPRWPSAFEEAQIRSGARLSSEPVITSGTVPAPGAQQRPEPGQRTSPARETPPAQETAPVRESAPAREAPPARETAPARETTRESAPVQPEERAITASPRSETDPRNPVSELLAPDVLLQRAQNTFENGNVTEAIALLDMFMENYPGGSDEVYWLLGQFYEANSPSRNILLSLDYYRRLINEYPQSRRFNDARRRIAYLERFYINIQ